MNRDFSLTNRSGARRVRRPFPPPLEDKESSKKRRRHTRAPTSDLRGQRKLDRLTDHVCTRYPLDRFAPVLLVLICASAPLPCNLIVSTLRRGFKCSNSLSF